MLSLKKNFYKVEAFVKQKHAEMNKQHINELEFLDDQSLKFYNKKGVLLNHYIPPPTVHKFLDNEEDHTQVIRGPVGSAKSTAMWVKLYRHACLNMPVSNDGVVHFRVLVLRNTFGDLLRTTMRTWGDWFGSIGTMVTKKNAPWINRIQTFNYFGKKICFEIDAFGCDKTEQFQQFFSLEMSAVYLNEMGEMPAGIIGELRTRIGRFPSRKSINYQKFTRYILGDTNGIRNKKTWYHEIFEEKKPPKFKEYLQPAAAIYVDGEWQVNHEAENIENLPERYYDDMIHSLDDNRIRILACAEYGEHAAGTPVYKQFIPNLHSVEKLSISKDAPVYIGWDFGGTPACVVCQFIHGVLYVIKEFVSKISTSTEELAKYEFIPYLQENGISHSMVKIYYDPSNPTGQGTKIRPSEVLDGFGFNTMPGLTNAITARIDSVKSRLINLHNGMGAIQVSQKGCPNLYDGFCSEYVYEEQRYIKDGRIECKDTPRKSHPISDVHDSLQYVALNFDMSRNNNSNASEVARIFQSDKTARIGNYYG